MPHTASTITASAASAVPANAPSAAVRAPTSTATWNDVSSKYLSDAVQDSVAVPGPTGTSHVLPQACSTRTTLSSDDA